MKNFFLLISIVTLNAVGGEIKLVGSRGQRPEEPYQRYDTSQTHTIERLKVANAIAQKHKREWEEFAKTVEAKTVTQDQSEYGPVHDNDFFINLHLPLLQGVQAASSGFKSKQLTVTQCPHTAIDLLPFIPYDGTYRLIIISKYIPRLRREKYATVGGITEYGETFEQTATREAQEEAHLTLNPESLLLLGARSNPNRDPRGRHIASIYYGCISKEMPQASDEAYRVFLATEKGINNTEPEDWCAPDHKEMALEAFTRLNDIIEHDKKNQSKQ